MEENPTENTAVNFVKQQRRLPKMTEISGIPVALLPPGSTIKAAPELLEKPVAFSRKATLKSETGLIRYIERMSQSPSLNPALFFEPKSGQFEAVFDDPSFNPIGWGNDRCVFTMERHRILKQWLPFLAGYAAQSEWIEFLDDRSDDFVSPSPADMISLVRNFRATKSAEFHHVEHDDNGDVDLGYSTNTVPDASIQVPTDIEIRIPFWEGGDRVTISGRFRYKVAGGRLVIRIHLKGLDDLLEADAMAVVGRVEKATGLVCIEGAPGDIKGNV